MEEMKKELEGLKESINGNDEVAGEDVAQELLLNITPVLENPGEVSFEYHRALMKALNNAVKAFEVRHPRLVDEIRIIIDDLNELGI